LIQDDFALRSHKLAAEAQSKGYLSDIIPVKVPKVNGFIDKDNGIRVSAPEQVFGIFGLSFCKLLRHV
jgi:acetyl-CoA acyltransferase